MIEKVENGVIFGAPQIQKKLSDFSIHWHAIYNVRQRTSVPSMSLSRLRDASGRLYGCGKTGQNTDLLENCGDLSARRTRRPCVVI